MFARRQRVSLPMHDSAFSQIDFSQAAVQKDKKFSLQESTYNRGKMDLSMLAVGQVVCVQDEQTGQWPTLTKVTEIRPDRLLYIVENDGKEILRSRAMLCVEKPTLGTDHCQGQASETRGVSSPASSHDLVYQPLPIVPLRRSDRLKDKDIVVPCAILKPKKKNSLNSGSCSGLPGLSDRQNNKFTTTAEMNRQIRSSTNPAII